MAREVKLEPGWLWKEIAHTKLQMQGAKALNQLLLSLYEIPIGELSQIEIEVRAIRKTKPLKDSR